MRRLASALLLICAAAVLPACGSTNASTPAATHTTTAAAAGSTSTTATGPDGRCANAVPASVTPPSGQWPTPPGYLTYSQAAHAASVALHSAGHSTQAAAAARHAESAAAEYRKASSQPSGGPNNPYIVGRASLDLEAAAHLAVSAGLPVCAKALQHLALDASGTLGQPANPASCGPGNVPVLGGCVKRALL